jgi:MFS family permease
MSAVLDLTFVEAPFLRDGLQGPRLACRRFRPGTGKPAARPTILGAINQKTLPQGPARFRIPFASHPVPRYLLHALKPRTTQISRQTWDEIRKTPRMPHGVGNAFAFQVFNTVSYSIVLGAPMLVWFKGLEASGTILGIVAALPPLLNILQMPAARFVEQVGYRAFVLRGWTLRSLFVLGMAIVPVLPPAIDTPTRMALMLFLLFAYNTSRGISVCGFLPWITQWIPEHVRGRYISIDQMCSSTAVVATLLGAAWYLRDVTASRIVFAGLFAASFVSALISLSFLRRIPDVPPPRQREKAERVPWREMAMFPPFFRLLVYDVIIFAGLAGTSVFWVPCLRDEFRLSDPQILLFGSVAPFAMTVSLLWLGTLIDHVGSRPVLALANVMFAIHWASWGTLAAKLMPLTWWSILVIQTSAGLGLAAFNVGNQRLAMSIVPEMGRSHFLALFSVVGGLTLGVLPVLWGLGLDSLAGVRGGWKHLEWNHFSILYFALVLIAAGAQLWHRRLTEPRAMTTDAFFNELLLKTPARALSRLLARRPLS